MTKRSNFLSNRTKIFLIHKQNEKDFGSIREKIRPFGHILDYLKVFVCLSFALVMSVLLFDFHFWATLAFTLV